jgi:hypothetical protein
VTGTVRDGDTGRPLPGAVAVLGDAGLTTTVTDSTGRYVFRDVPAGPQHLAVRHMGYAERTLHALVPRSGRLEIDLALTPDPIRLPAVEVRGAAAMRGVETRRDGPFPDRRLSAAAVRNHPLLTEADVFHALTGVEAVARPEAPSGLHVRGGAAEQTAYLLDGIPVFSPYHAAGMFSAWNPDAIEDIALLSSAPSPALPDVLSGVVVATTRAPGSRLRTQGSLGSTQARVTVDGPAGFRDAGFAVSLRSGYPAILAPRDDPSHLRGETGDWLGKVETPAFGGRLRLLGYGSEDEIDAAVDADTPGPGTVRNRFDWQSRSLGFAWSRDGLGGFAFEMRGWSAGSSASATWPGAAGGAAALDSERRDEGFLLEVTREGSGRSTSAGIRLERSMTSYRVEGDGAPAFSLDSRTPVSAAFVRHTRPLGPRNLLEASASLMAVDGELHWGPRARIAWGAAEALTLSGSWARLHQFAQSLRNAESVAGAIFPVDLYVGAGAAGVPVASNSQWVVAADYRPGPGIRIATQVYTVRANGLLFSAPRAGGPFVTGAFETGRGRSRGLSIEGAVSASRVGILAGWTWQDVRLQYQDASYVPDHGARQLVEAGIILFPSASFSVRLGIAGAFDRRATAVTGAFEWESCNLLDRGCEFGGTPVTSAESLGGTRLPDYLRLDLGVRKHWHLELGGRDAALGAFASFTNLLGRHNLLTLATDPLTGARTQIEMRPRSPLAIGLDWWF